MRYIFFKDELVRLIWSKYMEEKKDEVRDYLESLKTLNPELQ